MKVGIVLVANLCLALLASSCASQTPKPSTYRWTKFVTVRGQPDPVPVEWVSTPEGAFAHSIEIPDPVPKDSGYREGMTSEEYFAHLCANEARDIVYRVVNGVEGFYFMRPPKRPTDKELMDRYKLEAPDIERLFQLYRPDGKSRSTIFVIPRWRNYQYVEERDPRTDRYELWHGRQGLAPDAGNHVSSDVPLSRYGVTWRGIKRPHDRESGIAGSEWIVIDLNTKDVLAVFRMYARTGGTLNTPDGIWWLNAIQCSSRKKVISAGYLGQQLYDLVGMTLQPAGGER